MIVGGHGPFESKYGPTVAFVVKPCAPMAEEVQIFMSANEARLDMVNAFVASDEPIGPVMPIQGKANDKGNRAWLWVDVAPDEYAEYMTQFDVAADMPVAE